MELNVTFRHMDPSDTIREHIETRMARLEKYFLKPESCHFIIETEKFRRKAEITLTDNGDRITACKTTGDLYESIDGAIHAIEQQLKKHKEKLRSHRT